MEEIQNIEHDLWNQSNRLRLPEEYLAWEERCNECLELLEEYNRTKRPRLSIGIQQSLITRIAALESLKHSLRRRFIREGAGHTSTEFLWREIDTAFKSRILTGAVINSNYIDPLRFLQNARETVLEKIRNALEKHRSVKVNVVFNGEFVTGDQRSRKSVSTKNSEIFCTTDLEEWYELQIVEPILTSLEEFQERDSGWALSRILNLTVGINKYNPLHAGCQIRVPREIALKKATINVYSKDNACFAWSVIAALYPATAHNNRESSYPQYTTILKFEDIEFPMSLNQITRFEKLNDISINVYGFEGIFEKKKRAKSFTFFPLRLTSQKRNRHVNLLYIQDQDDSSEGHYVWIKNLSRLVSAQLTKNTHAKFICDRYVQHLQKYYGI